MRPACLPTLAVRIKELLECEVVPLPASRALDRHAGPDTIAHVASDGCFPHLANAGPGDAKQGDRCMWLEVLKLVHVLGAAVLFGTGAGIAFFMLVAHRTGKPVVVAAVARMVVRADFLFTATAVALQPVSGVLLAQGKGWRLGESWILASLALYVFVGLCWLPVVAIQIRMARLAGEAAVAGAALPRAYHRLFRIWFALGWPAFAGVLAIFWLMIAKPVLW